MAQTNVSVNRVGAVRGVHYADVPPGQAKLVACLHGAILDVIVDLRVGSPTFGAVETVRLDAEGHRTVYLAEGLGHGFCALTDGAGNTATTTAPKPRTSMVTASRVARRMACTSSAKACPSQDPVRWNRLPSVPTPRARRA